MKPEEVKKMIKEGVQQGIQDYMRDARYSTKNSSFHTHNGIDSPLLTYVPLGFGYLMAAADTNGTSSVNVFSPYKAPYNMTITGVFLISKDTTAGNITVAQGGNTVATIAKGGTAGVLVGATSLSNTSVAKGATFTVVSSTAGNATVFISFKTIA